MAPMTEVVKGTSVQWKSKARNAFEEIMCRRTQAATLALPFLGKVFKVESDASGVGVEGVFTQKGKPIAVFSERLCDAKKKYLTYDKDLYAIIRVYSTYGNIL